MMYLTLVIYLIKLQSTLNNIHKNMHKVLTLCIFFDMIKRGVVFGNKNAYRILRQQRY